MTPKRRFDGTLVFVGGCPRSGTTLLQNILDSHPDIAGGPEFDHLGRIAELRNFLKAGQDNGRLVAYDLEVDTAVSNFVGELLEPYRQRRGAKLLSEKTPQNALSVDTLLDIFPAARALLVVRDPRAVVASMLAVGERADGRGEATPAFTHSLFQAIDTIAQYNDAILTAGDRDRCQLVRYESLVADTETEARKLCGFLGVDWASEMLRPASVEHDGEKVLDDVWYTQEMYRADPDPSRVDSWHEGLGPLRRRLVESAFRTDPLLTGSLRYDLGQPTLLQRLTHMDGWLLTVVRRLAHLGRLFRRARSSLVRTVRA